MTPKLVRQEDSHGCVVAVLAMITGRTYAEIKADFAEHFDGTATRPRNLTQSGLCYTDAFGWLSDRGYAVGQKFRYAYFAPHNGQRKAWPPEPWADLHYCGVEIVGAYSHAVLMLADGTVLDPMCEQPRRLSDYAVVNQVAAVCKLPPAGAPQ